MPHFRSHSVLPKRSGPLLPRMPRLICDQFLHVLVPGRRVLQIPQQSSTGRFSWLAPLSNHRDKKSRLARDTFSTIPLMGESEKRVGLPTGYLMPVGVLRAPTYSFGSTFSRQAFSLLGSRPRSSSDLSLTDSTTARLGRKVAETFSLNAVAALLARSALRAAVERGGVLHRLLRRSKHCGGRSAGEATSAFRLTGPSFSACPRWR